MTQTAESSTQATSSSNELAHPKSKEVGKRKRMLEDLSFSSPGPAFIGTPSSSDIGDDDSDTGVRKRLSRIRQRESYTSSTPSSSDAPLLNHNGIQKVTSLEQTKSSPVFRNSNSSIFRNFKESTSKLNGSDTRPQHLNHSSPARLNSKENRRQSISSELNDQGPSVAIAAAVSAPSVHTANHLPNSSTKASMTNTRGFDLSKQLAIKSPSKQASPTKRERLLSIKKQELDRVYRDHDGLVRELFHLTKFVTYFGFDPDIANQDRSDVFERFRMDYDLPTRLSGASGRATRRIVSAKRGDLDLQKEAEKKRLISLTRVEDDEKEGKHHPNGKAREGERRIYRQEKGKTVLLEKPKKGSTKSRKASTKLLSSSDSSSSSSEDSSDNQNVSVSVLAKRGRKKKKSQQPSGDLSSNSSESGQAPPKKKAFKEVKRAVSVEYVPRPPVVMELIDGIPRSRALLPSHLPLRPKYGGLANYLRSWYASGEYLGGGTGEMEVVSLNTLFEREKRDAASYIAIEEAKAQGLLQNQSLAIQTSQQNRIAEPRRTETVWDALLQEIVFESSKRRAETRNRLVVCKRVSRMIHLYWDEKLGRGERQKKVEERRVRALAKFTVREVRKQWKLAVNVIKARRALRDKEEKDRAGREQLKSILEQSTQMLGKQHRVLVQGEAKSEDDSESESESESEESDLESFTDEEELDESDVDIELDNEARAGVENGLDFVEAEDHPQVQVTDDGEDDLDKNGAKKKAELSTMEDVDDAILNEKASVSAEVADVSLEEEETGSGEQVSAKVGAKMRPPFLLRGNLRPYQQIGFEWLANLYNNGSNGILADEMGLGKTIQTISVLAHLACDKGEWGPHLVVAPTSVMLNWEVEFKKFLPGFKILSYYGSQKERKEKRRGWNSDNHFNVCITSYQLVLADQHILRRKAWQYLILDEAHHIKNFKSQRWQTLLGFNSKRRLLLTGTPLQNNLMDLWSLMYFLMPNGVASADGVVTSGFASMKEFQQWFSNPLGKAVENAGMEGEDGQVDDETRGMVSKLHTLLRPYLLRRMKSEVEKELPNKYEHVIRCRLSKRQKFLYNDFMSRAKTRESLASGNYLSIINCLMQLRKVCNHPDLFEQRPIVTSFASQRSVMADFEIKELLIRRELLQQKDHEKINLNALNLQFNSPDRQHLTPIITKSLKKLDASKQIQAPYLNTPASVPIDTWTMEGYKSSIAKQQMSEKASHWKHLSYLNRLRCQANAPDLFDLGSLLLVESMVNQNHLLPLTVAEKRPRDFLFRCDYLNRAILTHDQRREQMQDVIDRFAFVTPRAVTNDITRWALPGFNYDTIPEEMMSPSFDTLHQPAVKLQIAFPDASLLQYDCGKLQELALLMQRCKAGGHRILIFTQMTKILDILETWLSYNGFKYLRLDGSTKVEDRQALTERFNRDDRITAFILSTRSGGLGINLTGADMVLFWDLDWNFQIEAQCMDRAHRIGQTRDVHIYRFVSEHTIEENMLKKSNEKRMLDNMVIQNGQFTTEGLSKMSWIESMFDEGGKSIAGVQIGGKEDGLVASDRRIETAMNQVEDEEDATAAKRAQMELNLIDNDFEREMNQDKKLGIDAGPQETIDKATATEDGAGIVEIIDEEDEEEGEEGGTVDDFMLKRVDTEWDYFVNL